MNVYTEVYEKTVELLKSPALVEDWVALERDLKALLLADGPDIDKSKALEDLRDQLSQVAKKQGGVSAKAKAKEIVRAARADADGFQERAAMLKQLRHFYAVSKKGSQSVWVVDQPRGYGQWNFDLFSGKSAVQLTELLTQGDDEVFGSGNRQMLSDCLQHARKWSADTEIKLADNSAATKAMLRRWFHVESESAADVETTRLKLLAGFKLITGACNSNKIIFSDRPHLRAGGTYHSTFASVNALDKMAIIYIYELFLKTGKRTLLGKVPKMWLCALTVVHELSHKLVGTEDHRYDSDGLKPSDAFGSDKASTNADSWAYFCADLLGHVPKAALAEAWS